jgi:C-terminal processing protease CtpA/Prc
VAKVLAELEQKYVFPDLAKRQLPELKKRWKSAAFSKHTRVGALLTAMNADLKELFNDGHLSVTVPLPGFGGAEQTPEEMDAFLRKMHYDIRRAEVLPGNVGYVQLNLFADYVSEGFRRALADAMNFVSDTDALVLDLRNHHGGDLPSVALFVSYFTEGRVHLLDAYDRISGKTEQSWTFEKVEGRRYGTQRDVYVLISRRTFSAGEEFAYDMQGLKRATLIGETTGGGANNNMFITLSEHLVLSMPFGTVKSVFTGTNWEHVGVKPDVAVEPHRALRVAHETAVKRLHERAASPEDKKRLGRALEWIRAQPEEPAPASAARPHP